MRCPGSAFAEGGYFAPAWGWAAIGFLWVAVVALLLRPIIRLGRLDAVFLAGLLGLAVWTVVSTAWSANAKGSCFGPLAESPQGSAASAGASQGGERRGPTYGASKLANALARSPPCGCEK